MGKKFKKLISLALSFAILATFCTVPMTASAEAGASTETTYDKYDEVTYDDLKLNGNSLDTQHTLSGGITFTYDATSPSYSAVLKYRFIAGSKPGVQFSFDEGASGNISYPFGAWIKRPNSDGAGENGAWHLKPDTLSMVNMSTPLVQGTAYDIELGRLKVLTGENAGKYYVYLKVDGELIQEGYSAVDENGYYTSGSKTDCQISNKIRFGCWGNGAEDKMTASPVPETYDEYDEVTYDDLKLNGNSLETQHTLSGGITFTYDATSPSYSAVLKYRFIAGSKPGVQFSFDAGAGDNISYPFGAWIKRPNSDGAGENGAWHLKPDTLSMVNMSTPLVQGTAYDIELGRLKVLTGKNAGKYYVYLKVDGELIQEGYSAVNENGYYTSGSKTDCQISNKIRFGCWGNGAEDKMTATPPHETYDNYDEVTYSDLKLNGNSLNEQTTLSGGITFTYDATSPSYSAVLKYRFIAGSKPGVQFSFDEGASSNISYPFGAWIKRPNSDGAGVNGAWHLKPDTLDMVNMSTPLVQGTAYDIELGRLKVLTGAPAHVGQYYVYLKVDGELIQEGYSAVDENGYYTSGSRTDCQLSNKIRFGCWGNGAEDKMTAIPYVEEYEAYDEIGFEDLKDADGNSLGSQKSMSGANVFTYDKTSATGSVIFKYRWKIGDVAKFQLSFDKTADNAMAYMFGAWLAAPGEEANFPNGRMWLRPAYGPQINLTEAFTAGTSHNIEFARLKVKNGPNAGKYYVYIKIDDVLVAEDYVAADVVDANGNYTTNPGTTTLAFSNEIFFAFWGSEGNIITSYRDPNATHEGAAGDFDNDGLINAADLVVLRKILLGTQDTSEMPEGIADFNIDGEVNILDLVVMKKYLASANTYARQGSLALGTQEHLLSDSTKTAEYIADASAVLGASAYRLSRPIHTLYNATLSNGVTVNETNMAKFRAMVEALKAKGINEILYVTDAFVLPYGYYNSETTHHKTVPDPETDTENYIAWLTVNAAAFKALAEEFPEIKYFEPYNEPNVGGNRLEKYGIGWNATEEEQAAHVFTTTEKAGIMADLCWYISRAVKSADTANQVTTPSLSVDTNHSHVDGTFLDALYAAIEAGNHPTNRVVADKRVDNYFTIINIHSYVSYSNYTFSYKAQNNVNEWAARINAAYDVVKAHGDGGSRVWLSETGMSTSVSDGRDEDKAATFITLALNKLDSDLTFIDTVFIYKLADRSSDMGQSAMETAYGLFYSGDDLDNPPYGAKATAKAVYSFCHNGSTDYSALDALVSRYAE